MIMITKVNKVFLTWGVQYQSRQTFTQLFSQLLPKLVILENTAPLGPLLALAVGSWGPLALLRGLWHLF